MTQKQNGIHWRMPTAMITCFIIGVGLAIGHHFYYYSLDGTRVGNQSKQEWALRFGTGMAFLTKTFLATAVGIACIQNFWWILRLKPIRLSTLDSMFDIRGNIFNFFDLHIWLRGPNVAVLGLISWLIPLVTVITPSTLSVQSRLGSTISERPMPNIIYEFSRYGTQSEGGPGGPASILTRQIMSSVVQGSVLRIPAPAPNASYTLDFIAPYVQCQKANDYVNHTVNQYLWDHSDFRNNYISFTTSGNLTDDLRSLMEGDSDNMWFWHDVNATEDAGKLVLAAYDRSPLRSVIECAMYNASYIVNFTWTNGEQSTEIVDRKVLNRVLPVTERTPYPAPANENEMLSYTAIMNVLNNIFVGICFSYPQRCASSQVFSTSLTNTKEMYRMVFGSDAQPQTELIPLAQAAAQMGDNITLSFFSNPFYLQNSTQAQRINVTVYENETLYHYSQRNLFIGYGVSVFVSLLCVITGLLTMWDNGIAFNDSLSTVLRATRNQEFDDIVPNDSTTGADPPPEPLSNTRVLWVPSNGRDNTVAGLKPLPALAEPEKAESASPQSSISFSNRIRERKSYRQTVSRVETSPDGFI
ncbi:hypothetical protein BDV12DRAFT_193756 [Aspergillus spectabilis]